jgi:tetratricopeptide (TPR) repeat protein
MSAGRRRERLSWLSDHSLPFAVSALTPLVTVPLSASLYILAVGSHEPRELGLASSGSFVASHQYAEFEPTVMAFTLPGLLNLVPLAWAASGRRWVRIAALVAALVGLLRLAVPLAVLLLAFERVTAPDGTRYLEFEVFRYGVPPSPYTEIWIPGLMAWTGTLLVSNVFTWAIPLTDRALEPLALAREANEEGRWQDAIAAFDRAIWFHPKLIAAWRGRSRAYAALGDPGRALADLEKALPLADAEAKASVEAEIARLKDALGG